jgi:hypothetical protein
MNYESVAQLIQNGHYAQVAATLSPLAKSFLQTYMNNASNLPVLSELVESLSSVAFSEAGRKLAEPTLAKLEAAAGALNSLCAQTQKAKQDLYLLAVHPDGGNNLFNAFHKEESITAMGLKIDDPAIDKLAREVAAQKKAAANANKKPYGTGNGTRGRGAHRGAHKKQYSQHSYTGRDFYNHGRDSYNHGGPHYHNSHRGSYHGFRGGRGGGSYPSAPHGSFYPSPNTNGQGQQNSQNTFPPKQPMIGWFNQG